MIYLHNIKTKEITTFENLKQIQNHLNLKARSLTVHAENNRVIDNKYILSIDGIIKPKTPKLKTYYIHYVKENTCLKIECDRNYLKNKFKTSDTWLSLSIKHGYRLKRRYIITKTAEMPVKKTNKQKNNPKDDNNINGEFKLKEPNKPIVRKGKYGIDELKKRLQR